MPALIALREEGVIGRIGAGDGNAEMLARFAAEADIDVVLEAGRYTLPDRTAERSLPPVCAEHGVEVIAAGVFNSGLLATSDPRPGAKFEYVDADATNLTTARTMAEVCASHGVELPSAALQFPLRNASVKRVVVGAEAPDQIAQVVNRFRAPVPPALWDDLPQVANA